MAYTPDAHALFREERAKPRLDGWFLLKEIAVDHRPKLAHLSRIRQAAELLRLGVAQLPLTISDHAMFAGSQSDCFARSYALINPAFTVETFTGYCDPTAVYDCIEPNEEFAAERIASVRERDRQDDYCQALYGAYGKAGQFTEEVAFFFEQVTGHIIPDMRPALRDGLESMLAHMPTDTDFYKAAGTTLQAAITLAGRYADIAAEKAKHASDEQRSHWERMEKTLRKVPARGADNLYEAIQSFLILWQVMCIEQSPNPFAFSVGNADRIFEPYRAMDDLSREQTAEMFRHFLVFFNVGDRSWAISQNVLAGGRDVEGNDLTSTTTLALLDAYFEMNLPQPILSVKLHKNTPDSFYRELGRFLFTPGRLTPSFFNDDAMFEVMRRAGIEERDLADYSVAGCQEPLVMGKDNGNTTNSWLNLGKILELTLTGGVSLLTGKTIGGAVNTQPDLSRIREEFYANTAFFMDEMAKAANDASRALSLLPVPFLSCFMGGLETGYDMRDCEHQGTKYNASGCLIHGLSVVADSFIAIDRLLAQRPQDAPRLLDALRSNFESDPELREFLLGCPKFGNNLPDTDAEAVTLARRISDMIKQRKNYLGNPFRADWSTPSTHLLYGYWVGATPDGRAARDMLNYGVDPLHGDAGAGIGFRVLSALKLPYEEFNGGYASHLGIDPKLFTADTLEGKGEQFAQRVTGPLFFNEALKDRVAPFYLYVNVTTAETLRKVLSNPKKYAPSGVYIMRIHGTFVNFLDLSPAIQEDIIRRLAA